MASVYTDVDRIELPEIDCALLTALLEESLPENDDGDDIMENPCSVAQSPAATCEDCALEDMLLDTITSVSTTSMINVDEYCSSFRWLDMDVVVPSSPASDDMGDWFMGTGAGEVGMVVDYDDISVDYDRLYSYYGGDVTVEDGYYGPLWQ